MVSVREKTQKPAKTFKRRTTIYWTALAVGVLAALFTLVPRHLFLTYACDTFIDMTTSERDILPTNVKPFHYDLTITPDLTIFKFRGVLKIGFGVLCLFSYLFAYLGWMFSKTRN